MDETIEWVINFLIFDKVPLPHKEHKRREALYFVDDEHELVTEIEYDQ